MARLELSIACLITSCVCVSAGESGNFPLENCSTDDMDVLFLYTAQRTHIDRDVHEPRCLALVQHLQSFPSNRTTPRVMTAAVYDRFSAHNPEVNVSSWQFGPSLKSSTFGFDQQQQPVRQIYDSVKKSMELKVQFVQRLFSEMGGVRKEATKIAVVFLDGFSFSIEEARSIPGIVARQRTDVKIFVVVFGAELDSQTVLMDSTIIVREYPSDYNQFILVLAICNQCMEGWWTLEHRSGVDSLSCYRMIRSDVSITWGRSFSKCFKPYSAHLAFIETHDELVFLRGKIISFLEEVEASNGDCTGSCPSSCHVSIGLFQKQFDFMKRFVWDSYDFYPERPLVVNHWLPGQPSGRDVDAGGVWQFVWSQDKNDTGNIFSSEGSFVDGWTEVEEYATFRFCLCEIVLPRRIEDNIKMRIEPATDESWKTVLAKGNFVNFRGNIVSFSTYISNPDLVRSLNESDMFPVFDCGVDVVNWRYISYPYVCDDIDHCSNRRDEVYCVPKTTVHATISPGVCKGVTCCDGSCLPVKFVNDGQIDCLVCDSCGLNVSNDESEVLNLYLKRNQTCAFICDLDTCVEFSQLNNGMRDCWGVDGPLDETIGKLKTADTCFNILGHSIWAPECVFVRDRYGVVMGCRDMSHLKNCSGFECPEGYVKCPNTYCIPQHYVLDGQADCPKGEDEQRDNIEPCTGNFACWDSQVCLHPDLVCDGHPDCPHQDDEVDCHTQCPLGFRCVSGIITVSDFNTSIPLSEFEHMDKGVRYLDLSGVDLSVVRYFYVTQNIAVILLSNCSLINVDRYIYGGYLNLQKMDLSNNLLHTFDGRNDFNSALRNIRHLNLSYNKDLADVRGLRFKVLDTLDLSHTSLAKLDQSFIGGFPNLRHLNLSFTFIDAFLGNHIPSRLILQSLDLRGLGINRLFEDFFNSLTVSEHLYTERFELCCPQIRGPSIPTHVCHAPVEAISSCFDLIGDNVQRVLLWVVAVLAVLGNMTVIVYRIIWDRSVLKTGYGWFVTNLGISDFIMGVYLFIIAGADYYYRGVYVLHDKTWRESGVCKFAGFLATLSMETSIFFVFFITVDRFLVMKFPFGQIKFSKTAKIITTVLSWIIGFLLALTPIVMKFEIFSSNAMCLGLPLTAERSKGWEFSFAVFIVLNCFLCLVLACGQRAIFRAMSESRITGSASSTSPRRAADIMVAKQLSLIALSNFLCWFPVGCMGLLSVTGHEISNDVYAWTTIIVLPINSAANPLLYTIPVLLDKWDKFKHSGRRGASS